MFQHPQETLDAVLAHKARGLSARESGKILGMTRGAVMGLRYRLGLTETQVERPVKPKVEKPKPKPKPKLVAPPTEGLFLLELKSLHCRWPTSGEGADTKFCGGTRTETGPYCGEHTARAKGRSALDETSLANRAASTQKTNFAFPRKAS